MGRIRSLAVILTISIVAPIGMGAVSGALLFENSESYPSRELALRYYHALLNSDWDLIKQRNQYRNAVIDEFGQTRINGASCKPQSESLQLAQTFNGKGTGSTEADQILRSVGASASTMLAGRTTMLEDKFDYSAISGIARSGTLVGALSGCRYSILFPMCDAIGTGLIHSSLNQNASQLIQRKQEIDKLANEAICFTLADHDARLAKLSD